MWNCSKARCATSPSTALRRTRSYAANTLTVTNGDTRGREETGSAKRNVPAPAGPFRHRPPGFDVSSNVMPLEEIREIAALHPGMKGTLQATASGQVELQPATRSRVPHR